MNEDECVKGYDFALNYIHPKLIAQEFCLSKNKKTEDQRIEELFALTKTKPLYFKQGVKQCVQEWWHMTERVETMRKLPPIASSLACTELFIPSDGFMSCVCGCNVVDTNKHMDMHFRVNQLLTRILEPEKQTSFNASTPIQPQKMSTKTRIALLRMLEEPDLKNATRLRITKQLADAHIVGFFHPNQKPTPLKKQTTVARGWFASPKMWTTAPSKDVPMDVIRFGKLQLSNGNGLWRDTFPTADIPTHWQPWLLPMKSSSSYYVEKKQQQHAFGSKIYMQSLTVEQRAKDFIHTEDKYDDRLCAICGESFEVVLSGDPQDTLEEDFVLLHAIVDTVSRHFIHKHCSSTIPATKKEVIKATKKKPRQFFVVTSDSE